MSNNRELKKLLKQWVDENHLPLLKKLDHTEIEREHYRNLAKKYLDERNKLKGENKRLQGELEMKSNEVVRLKFLLQHGGK